MAKQVKYIISLEEKVSGGLNKAEKSVSRFEQKVMSAGKTLIGAFVGYQLIRAVGNLGKRIFDLGVDFEQTEIAFGTFLRSAEKGKKLLGELQQFAKVTPFTSSTAMELAKMLKAMGVETEKLIPTMGMLGDISAGVGMDKLPRLVLNLGQVKTQTKLTGRELRDFAVSGVPLLEELAKVTGKSTEEVTKMISKGQVDYDMVIKAMQGMTSEGGLFFNLMKKQSQSAGGLISTLKDNLELTGVALGKRLLPQVKTTTKGLINFTDKLLRIVKIPVSRELKEQKNRLNALLLELNNTNLSEGDRLDILREIKEINPQVNNAIKRQGDLYKINWEQIREINRQLINKIILQEKAEKIEEQQDKLNSLSEKQAEKLMVVRDKQSKALDLISSKNQKAAELVQGILDRTINSETHMADIRKKYGDEYNLLLNQSGLQISENERDFIGFQNIAIKAIAKRIGISQKQLGLDSDFYENLAEYNELFVDQLNTEKKLFSIEAERAKFAKHFGIDLTQKIVPDASATDMLSKITAQSPKIFNINIDKLVENINNNVTNLQEGMAASKKIVTEALLDALNQTQITALQ